MASPANARGRRVGCAAGSGSPTGECSAASCPRNGTGRCTSDCCTPSRTGWSRCAAGTRRDGTLQIHTRARADHFLPAGATGTPGWLEALLALAATHAARGEELFIAPAVRSHARGEKHAVAYTRALWVDVDQPGQLHHLWAFLAEKPCHLLIETGGSGGVHCYWLLDEPLPATRTLENGRGWSSRSNAHTCG